MCARTCGCACCWLFNLTLIEGTVCVCVCAWVSQCTMLGWCVCVYKWERERESRGRARQLRAAALPVAISVLLLCVSCPLFYLLLNGSNLIFKTFLEGHIWTSRCLPVGFDCVCVCVRVCICGSHAACVYSMRRASANTGRWHQRCLLHRHIWR